MFDLNNQLGIKSYSFRMIEENADVAEAVKQCQVNGIDLSACHVNYDDPAAQDRVIGIYREAAIRITGIGVVTLKNDKHFNQRYFDFAKRAGCDVISCSFDPQDHEEILGILGRLCDEYGMRAAIHNHGGRHWLGNSTILKYLFARYGKRIGLCLDTAWCLQAGEDPVAWLEMFKDRLYAVHFKDFVFAPNGSYRDTIIGEGALDLPRFLQKFLTLSFEGSAVIEYEGEDAIAQSAQCVQVIRAAERNP